MLDSEQDKMMRTAHNKIFIAPPMNIDLAHFYEELQNLQVCAEHNDEEVVKGLQRIVGRYHPNRKVNEDHTVSAAHGNTTVIDKSEIEHAVAQRQAALENSKKEGKDVS